MKKSWVNTERITKANNDEPYCQKLMKFANNTLNFVFIIIYKATYNLGMFEVLININTDLRWRSLLFSYFRVKLGEDSHLVFKRLYLIFVYFNEQILLYKLNNMLYCSSDVSRIFVKLFSVHTVSFAVTFARTFFFPLSPPGLCHSTATFSSLYRYHKQKNRFTF